jgi:hypothetical protein
VVLEISTELWKRVLEDSTDMIFDEENSDDTELVVEDDTLNSDDTIGEGVGDTNGDGSKVAGEIRSEVKEDVGLIAWREDPSKRVEE